MLHKLFGNGLCWLWVFYSLGMTATMGSVMIWRTNDLTKGGLEVVIAGLGPGILGGAIYIHVDYLLERRRLKKTHPEWME